MSKGKKNKIEKLKYDYMTNMKFEDARTIFMIITNMINVKMNYKNTHKEDLQCRRCNAAEEDTLHIFTCKEDTDIHEKIRRKDTVENILNSNSLEEVAMVAKKAIERREEEPLPKSGHTTAQLDRELSPPDGGQ